MKDQFLYKVLKVEDHFELLKVMLWLVVYCLGIGLFLCKVTNLNFEGASVIGLIVFMLVKISKIIASDSAMLLNQREDLQEQLMKATKISNNNYSKAVKYKNHFVKANAMKRSEKIVHEETQRAYEVSREYNKKLEAKHLEYNQKRSEEISMLKEKIKKLESQCMTDEQLQKIANEGFEHGLEYKTAIKSYSAAKSEDKKAEAKNVIDKLTNLYNLAPYEV